MGVIFLVGIVVANGVLLVDFANKLRNEGVPVTEAAIRAAATRFRPILMTFLATSLDLFPLALGLGKGNETITPLARAVVGGLDHGHGLDAVRRPRPVLPVHPRPAGGRRST